MQKITRKEADVHNSERRLYYLNKFDNKCFLCDSTRNLQIDHIIPITLGGDNSEHNIQVLCKLCNCKKGGKKHKGDDHHTRKNPRGKTTKKVTVSMTEETKQKALDLSVLILGTENISGYISYLINKAHLEAKK